MKKKTMTKIVSLLIAAVMVFALFGCGSSSSSTSSTSSTSSSTASSASTSSSGTKQLNVFLDLSCGGLGDKGFNDLTFEGLKKAGTDLNIKYDYAEPKSYSECEAYVMDAASSKEYDLIIGIGYDNYSAVDAASQAYPDQKFVLLQSALDRANVSCIKESLDQMGYLTGIYVGEMMSKDLLPGIEGNRSVGFIIGVDTDEGRTELYGFKAGIYDVCKDQVSVQYTEVGAWNDSATGKELALSLHEKGCGIVWHYAGTSGLGIFEAANEVDGLYVIGSSGNQNSLNSKVLCSTMDCMDNQVFNCIKDFQAGKFEAGTKYLGFSDDAIRLEFDGSSVTLPADIKTELASVQKKLSAGEIVPPDTEDEYNKYIAK